MQHLSRTRFLGAGTRAAHATCTPRSTPGSLESGWERTAELVQSSVPALTLASACAAFAGILSTWAGLRAVPPARLRCRLAWGRPSLWVVLMHHWPAGGRPGQDWPTRHYQIPTTAGRFPASSPRRRCCAHHVGGRRPGFSGSGGASVVASSGRTRSPRGFTTSRHHPHGANASTALLTRYWLRADGCGVRPYLRLVHRRGGYSKGRYHSTSTPGLRHHRPRQCWLRHDTWVHQHCQPFSPAASERWAPRLDASAAECCLSGAVSSSDSRRSDQHDPRAAR